MLKIEKVEVVGWEHAIRGMRNPMNSWEKSDSEWVPQFDTVQGPVAGKFIIGPNDYALMKKLRKAGTDHRKFMRMITVYLDITAPMYWWKEFDTYMVGTVVNSYSTMHKIHEKEFTINDFSHEHLLKTHKTPDGSTFLGGYSETLKMIVDDLNYEVLANIYESRKDHKLDEWHTFCHWIEELPYSELITGYEEE